MPRSTFRLTVPQAIYDAVCDACGQDFADAYLWGATLASQRLEPRTLTAFVRMEQSRALRGLLQKLGVVLIQPLPWRHGNGKPFSEEEFGPLRVGPTR